MSYKSMLTVCVLLGATQLNSAFADFISWPGLHRISPNDDVTLTWRLDSADMTGSGGITRPDRADALVITYHFGVVITYGPGYDASKVTLATDVNGFILTLININTADAGQYKCEYTPPGQPTVENQNATIYVYGIPSKPSIPPPGDMSQGTTVTLACTGSTSTSQPVSHQQPLIYIWRLNGTSLTDTPQNRHTVNGNQLTITGIAKDDMYQLYTCATTETGGPQSDESDDITLPIIYPPGPASAVDDTIGPLNEGENPATDLECTVSDPGYPTATFTWSKGGSGGSDGVYTITANTATVTEHDGVWRCTPTNSGDGGGDGAPADVTVTVNARATDNPALPATHTAVADDLTTLTVTCGFTSKPEAVIYWTYNGGPTLPSGVITEAVQTIPSEKVTVTQKLVWDSTSDVSSRRGADGTYRCNGTVNLGTGETDKEYSQMILNVQFEPHDIQLDGSSSQTAVAGVDRVTRKCIANGNPGCTYQWKDKDGSEVGIGDTLDLNPVQEEHHGSYTCRATNIHNTVGISTQFNLTVYFGSKITSFLPSTYGDIIEGSTLDITCDVSSRPNSNITITNTNTTATIRSVNDVLTTVYKFISIHVLDSAIYQCSAVNGITPVNQGTQLTLTVNGGFSFCETPPSSEGSPLGGNITIHICLTANPFTPVSSNNWQFELHKSTLMTRTLPAGTSTTTDDTSHMYKKFVLLMIPDVLVSHFGVYTLTVKNEHNTDDLVHELVLVPEGKPEHPTDWMVTDATAVSIYLQWMAGFDGGPDQTFWLYVTDMISGTGFMVTDIPDTTGPDGGLITYYLTSDKHGLVHDRSYTISVGAINNIGNVTNPQTTTAQTKAEPSFEGEEPQIVYTENTAQITWSVNNLGSVSYILIDVCISDSVTCGPTENITAPEIQPYIVTLPEGEAQGYTFSFIFYDGVDKVQTHELEDLITDPPPIAVIVGAVIGVLLAAGGIVAFVILWRRGIIPIKTLSSRSKKKPDKNEVQSEYLTTVELSASGSGYEELDQITQQSPGKQQHVPVIYQDLTVPSLNEMMRSEFTLDTILSNGDYYSVWNGKLNVKDSTPLHVIIKTTTSTTKPSDVQMRYLQDQGVALSSLRSCDYTIGCLGITKDNKFLIMDNAPLGNLREYLQAVYGAAYGNVGSVQTNCTEMDFIHQAISGVVAVQELQPPALFYCLSSSHVLVTSHRQCKISGFALADTVKAREEWEETNKSSRPIKWLAPEAIELKHTAQSDVWSLAILMWEILNNGKSPLEDTNDDNARQQILGGFRPFKTPSCFNEIYNIMCRCWMYEPADRSSVSDIQLQYLELNQYEPV